MQNSIYCFLVVVDFGICFLLGIQALLHGFLPQLLLLPFLKLFELQCDVTRTY